MSVPTVVMALVLVLVILAFLRAVSYVSRRLDQARMPPEDRPPRGYR